jgi:hypothetical protein
VVQDTKGKDAEIAKWEAELKKSLATKKASTTVSLTKQEQALVQLQVDKESRVRQHVNTVQAQLERGLGFVRSLVAADVPQFYAYISTVASLLLEGVLSPNGSVLVGKEAFDTYLVGNLYLTRCIVIDIDY